MMSQHVVHSAISASIATSANVSARVAARASTNVARSVAIPRFSYTTAPGLSLSASFSRSYSSSLAGRSPLVLLNRQSSQTQATGRTARLAAPSLQPLHTSTSLQARFSSSWNSKTRQAEDAHLCTSCNRRFKSDDSHVRRRDNDQSSAVVNDPVKSQSTSEARDQSSPTHQHPSSPQEHAPHNQGHHHHHALLDRLPHLHRPTKEELLAAATGFWQRLAVRFKWFSIRSARPFNTDDFSAFISWIVAAHVLWIVLGTTTFVSLAVLAINSIFAQGVYCYPGFLALPTLTCHYRNPCWMDRQLPHQIHRRQSRLRVGRRTQVEGWCHHLQKRLCL